jgi:hypothetical protein
MVKLKNHILLLVSIALLTGNLSAQKIIRVLPKEIDDVLINPGIGFQTYQRFNGDKVSDGWGEEKGFPKKYQKFDGYLSTDGYPMTSLAYFRTDWRNIEPEMGKYNWEMIDITLKMAHEHGQTLAIRISPYGSGKKPNDETDVPAWYRAIVGERNEWLPEGRGWRVDPEDPRYAQYFGRMISELGKRYDGHPDLEYVDLSIVGFWGEGRGSAILSQKTREALVKSYTDNFKKTPLLMLLINGDEKTEKYGLSQANVGWRVDCVGDLGLIVFDHVDQGGWSRNWNHMYDFYPQMIIKSGMQDAWKKAPISLEVCGTIKSWHDKWCETCEVLTADTLKYIISETLKWHISSFNNKSSPVPEEWRPLIDEWLKKMGYRFVLRRFSYPEYAVQGGQIEINSWWDNKGVAPIYKKYLLAVRLVNMNHSEVFITDADINSWFPGDNLYNDRIFVPWDIPAGIYQLQIGIVDPKSHKPKVNLAIEGKDSDGWYKIGQLEIKESGWR